MASSHGNPFSNYYSSGAFNRNRRRSQKGNVLRYQIPGLQKAIDIPFPDRKLPVCKRCKKIYKTRELCRVRDGHTAVPWNTTYICVSLDDSCFIRNSRGEQCLVEEGPGKFQFFSRSIPGPPMPYCTKKNSLGGTKAPICISCKDKNYTRHHCREKQGHLQLPWGAVYVMLYAAPCSPSQSNGNGGFIVEDEWSQHSVGSKRTSSVSSSSPGSTHLDQPSNKKSKLSNDKENKSDADEEKKEQCDSIHDVEPSKAFLLTIKNEDCILRWLDIDPLVSRAEHGHNYAHNMEMENSMYPSQFNQGSSHYSNAPPPQGWSGYSSGFQENDRYSQDWNDGLRKMMPSNQMNGTGSNFSSHGNYSHHNDNAGNQGSYGYSNQNGYPAGIQEGDDGGPSFYQDENFNNSNFMHPSLNANPNKPPSMNSQGPGGFMSRQNSSMPDYMQQGGGRDLRGSNHHNQENFQGNNSGSAQRSMIKGEPPFFPSREGPRGADNGFNRQGHSNHPSNGGRDFGGPSEPPFFPSREGPRVPENGFNRQGPSFPSRIESYQASNGRDFCGPSNVPNVGPVGGHPNGGGSFSGFPNGGRPNNGFGPAGYGPKGPLNGMSMNSRQHGSVGPRNVHNGQKDFGPNDPPSQQGSPQFGAARRRSMGGPPLPMDNINGPPVLERRGDYYKPKNM